MGLPSARRKQTNIGQTRPAAGPIPGSAIPARLINLDRFDKTRPPAIQRPLTIAAALRLRITVEAAIEPFSQGRFTARLAAAAELGAESQFSVAMMRGAFITRHVYRAAGGFIGANRGNVAVIFAITLVPVLGLIGAAIDYSRANGARSTMQAALDSTALMLSRDLSQGLITPSEINARAQSYFTALYNNGYTKPVAIRTTYMAGGGTGSTLQVSGSGAVTAGLMKMAGLPNITFDLSSTAAWGNARPTGARQYPNDRQRRSVGVFAERRQQLRVAR
jgi:Flp pilus assembly protein TadG